MTELWWYVLISFSKTNGARVQVVPFGPASNLPFPWLPSHPPEPLTSTALLPLFSLCERVYSCRARKLFFLLSSHIKSLVTLIRSSEAKVLAALSCLLPTSHPLGYGQECLERELCSLLRAGQVLDTQGFLLSTPCCWPAMPRKDLLKLHGPSHRHSAFLVFEHLEWHCPAYSHEQRFRMKVWAYPWLPKAAITGNITEMHV